MDGQPEFLQDNAHSQCSRLVSQNGLIRENGTPHSNTSEQDKLDTSNLANHEAQVLGKAISLTSVIKCHDESLQNNDNSQICSAVTKQEFVREKIHCHSSFLAKGLYLLWTTGHYCDGVLVVEDQELKCHSCLIASFSPLLQMKLNSTPQKTRLEGNRLFVLIDLTGSIAYDEIETLVRYMYTGELHFKKSQMYKILKGAQFLGLKEIQQFCFVWMAQNITITPSVEMFKSEYSDIIKEDAQKSNSEQIALTNSVNAAKNVNGKDTKFNFQDYLDILNSWQHAVTDDSSNITETVGNSNTCNALNDSSGEKILNSQQILGEDHTHPSTVAVPPVEVQEHTRSPDSPAPMIGAQRRKFRRQPVRYNAGEIRDRSKTIKPLCMDLLYVNFNNDKYLGADVDATGKKHKRIVVAMTSALDESSIKLKNVRKGSQPRKHGGKQNKRVKTELGTELKESNDDDNYNDDDIEDDVIKRKPRKRGKRKPQIKAVGNKNFIITVAGDTFTCFKARNKDDRMTLKCLTCNRPFTDANLIQQHMQNHRNNTLSACHICGHAYIRSWHLSRHIRLHSSISCKHCDFSTKSPKLFSKHSECDHGITKAFVCTHEGCSYATNKQHQLYDHMPIHSEIKPYKCARCGKTCAHRSGLASHMKSCLQKRDKVCDICGKAFNHQATLKSHRRLHFGEKPYACTICPSRFADHRTLKRHLVTHQKGGRGPSTPRKSRVRVMDDKQIEEHNRKTLDPNYRYMPQAFSVDPKPISDGPMTEHNLDLNQKSTPKTSNLDVPLTHVSQGQQFAKHTENAPLELNQGHYSHVAPFQEPQRKFRPMPPISESMRPLDTYQANISMAHAQPSMTSGYNAACLTSFSPLVAPEFYNPGFISTGHLDMHPHHPSIAQSGVRPMPAYTQLHDYTMANVWKSTHEDLNPVLHNHPHHHS